MSFNPAKEGLRLYQIRRPSRWARGIGAALPEEYRKFWNEWKLQRPTAVHYVEQQGKYTRNEKTGEVTPVQNIPLPLRYPKELDDGIWGGEAVVQGYQKRHPLKRRVPHFWVPTLKRSVVYSEVLDKYMSVIVTDRTIKLIHEHYGFDHYLLKTQACDLRSLLALKLKRQILVALADKTLYEDNPAKKNEVYAKYQQYLIPYTRKEIEWYGLTYAEACKKYMEIEAQKKIVLPLKIQYRSELIAKLKEEGIAEADTSTLETSASWMSKMNPFSKAPKA